MNRRALLSAFLAAPVAASLPALAPVAAVVPEVAKNIFVKDLGLWFASFPEMYRAFNWNFRNHVVEVSESYPGCPWTDMTGKPEGVMGYVIGCTFTKLGPPPPSPLWVTRTLDDKFKLAA